MSAALGVALLLLFIVGISVLAGWLLAQPWDDDAGRDAADHDKETPPPGWPGGIDHRRSPAQRARLDARTRGGR